MADLWLPGFAWPCSGDRDGGAAVQPSSGFRRSASAVRRPSFVSPGSPPPAHPANTRCQHEHGSTLESRLTGVAYFSRKSNLFLCV